MVVFISFHFSVSLWVSYYVLSNAQFFHRHYQFLCATSNYPVFFRKFCLCRLWSMDVLILFFQRCIQNPVKHLRWSILRKQVTIFEERPSQMFDRLLNRTDCVYLLQMFNLIADLPVIYKCKMGTHSLCGAPVFLSN